MSDDNRANIKVSREAYERHKKRKDALGVTWDEYLDGQAPELADVLDTDDLADAVADRLDR